MGLQQLERRLEALEAGGTEDELKVLFISFERPIEPKATLASTEWNKQAFAQREDETRDAFIERVKAAVRLDPPAGKNLAALFLTDRAR